MLLCIVKIRLFRVKSTGFHIINVASGHPHTSYNRNWTSILYMQYDEQMFVWKCFYTWSHYRDKCDIYIYRYRDNIYIVVFTHQQQRTTKKKKTKPVLPFCAIYKIWQYSSRPSYKGWKEQQRKEKQLCLEMQLNLRDVKGYWRWEGKVIHREACEEPQKMQWKHWDFAFLPKDESIWRTWW